MSAVSLAFSKYKEDGTLFVLDVISEEEGLCLYCGAIRVAQFPHSKDIIRLSLFPL